MGEYRALNLSQAIQYAAGQNQYRKASRPCLDLKRIPDVYAPPLFWGNWVDIHTQFGVGGKNPDQHVTRLRVSFKNAARATGAFGIQIRGGDDLIDTFGPGSEIVTISGNVVASIGIRAKSLNALGQLIDVEVR